METQIYALLDHAYYNFADAGSFDAALKVHSDELVASARRLHAYNERFNDSLQRGTTGTPNVSYRFARYRAMISSVLQEVPDGRRRRFFSSQQKQNIWDSLAAADRKCRECGNALALDDVEVDHVQPFAEGGETVESNGQLLHMACNRAKGARWDPVADLAELQDREKSGI